MTVENATYLKQLNPAYPEDGDLIKEGDDHIRLIKKTLRNTFKNIDRQVLLSTEQLNELASYKAYVQNEVQKIYPVGSVFISVNNTDPSVALGFGTWEAISQGRVLIGSGRAANPGGAPKFFSSGNQGGDFFYKLKSDQVPLPPHRHTYSQNLEMDGLGNYLDTVPVYKKDGRDVSKLPFKTKETFPLLYSEYVKKYGVPGKINPVDPAPELPGGTKNPLVGYDYVRRSQADYRKQVAGPTSTTNPTPINEVVPITTVQPYLVVNMWKRTA